MHQLYGRARGAAEQWALYAISVAKRPVTSRSCSGAVRRRLRQQQCKCEQELLWRGAPAFYAKLIRKSRSCSGAVRRRIRQT